MASDTCESHSVYVIVRLLEGGAYAKGNTLY